MRESTLTFRAWIQTHGLLKTNVIVIIIFFISMTFWDQGFEMSTLLLKIMVVKCDAVFLVKITEWIENCNGRQMAKPPGLLGW